MRPKDSRFASSRHTALMFSLDGGTLLIGVDNQGKNLGLEKDYSLVKKGGSPQGLLRFDKENSTIQGSYRPFEEYENEEWVKKYLAGLLDNTGDIIDLSRQKHSFPTAS